ncbi:glycoside hydrolase [Geopyxis carbonaria]|nr:glycoside hydrolase [Geopyxis carbonaria]
MQFSIAILAALVACAQPALAHYRFTQLIAGGAATGEYKYVRQNTNHNSPVSTGSTDLRCNTGADSGSATSTYEVAAGASLGFKMDQSIYHAGPVQVYISKAPSTAATYDGSGSWSKIYQVAPTFAGNGPVWGTESKDTFTFSLPSSLAAGEYLLRIEHIALHSMPAQFYVSCAQLKVTGSGSATPSNGISFPAGYSSTDPGINLNIYYPVLTSYAMPGPTVWKG